MAFLAERFHVLGLAALLAPVRARAQMVLLTTCSSVSGGRQLAADGGGQVRAVKGFSRTDYLDWLTAGSCYHFFGGFRGCGL